METRRGTKIHHLFNVTVRLFIIHKTEFLQDQLLLQSVEQYGRNWKAISGIQFERRPPLALKNRYSLLQRHIGGSRPARVSRRAGPNNSAGTSRSTSANRYHRESEGDDIDDSMEGGSSSEGDYEISTDMETSRGSPFPQRLSVQPTVLLPGAKSGTLESESRDTRYRSPEHRSSLNFNPSSTDLLSLCSDDPMLDISDFNINGNINFGTLQDSPNGTGNGIIPISASMLPIPSSSNSYMPTWDNVSTTIHSTSQASDGSFKPQKSQAPTLDSFQSSPSQLSPSHWSAALTESPRQQPNSSNRVSPLRRSGPTVLGSTSEGDLRKQVTITAFCDPERIGKLLQVVMEAVNSVTNHEEDTTVLLNVK